MYFLFLFSLLFLFCFNISSHLSCSVSVMYGQIAVLDCGLHAGSFEPLFLVFVMSLWFVMWMWVGVTSSDFIVKLFWKKFYFAVLPGTSEVLISPKVA